MAASLVTPIVGDWYDGRLPRRDSLSPPVCGIQSCHKHAYPDTNRDFDLEGRGPAHPLSAGAADAGGRSLNRRLAMSSGEQGEFSTRYTGFVLLADGRGAQKRTPKSEGNAG